ncbi:MAG: Oligoribonuclease [Cellulomonadaceae bacterium TMED98]|nr:MAG: Oligoribonuclease [Cellulomonadaceae bacterium TMED98]
MPSDSPKLVWLDAEMTGLDLEVDELIEVAAFVTDYELTILDEGFHVVIAPSAHALDQMGDFVRSMHTDSGLLDELPGGVSLEDAEERLMDYLLTHLPEPKTAPLAGNTIGTDRAFLQRYMPRVHEHLHYRNIDVSTIKELARQWYPKMYFQSPEKNGGHRAPADILESIRELAYYRQVAFVPTPGPSTTEIKKISDAVTEQFASGQLGD